MDFRRPPKNELVQNVKEVFDMECDDCKKKPTEKEQALLFDLMDMLGKSQNSELKDENHG